MRRNLNQAGRLSGSVALVTGASRGIGAALARELHLAGAKVAITGRNVQSLMEVAASIQRDGGECLAVPGDISHETDAQRAVDQTVSRFARVDVLINNAAICRYGPFESARIEDYQQIIDVNLKGPVLTSRAVLPVMRAQGGGDILNLASRAGLAGMANLALYCASKFALVGFSEALGRELEHDRVRVSYVCPSWVNTDMLEAFPACALPPRSEMTSPQSLARFIVDLLQTPYATDAGRLRRGFGRIARRFRRESIPVFRSL